MRNEFKWNFIFFTFFNLIGHAAHEKLQVLHDPSKEQISWLTTLSSKEFLAEEHVKGVAEAEESEAVTECDKCEKQHHLSKEPDNWNPLTFQQDPSHSNRELTFEN